ncbi:ATP-dependent DNA helicase UvrD/PcrA [Mycoplasmopsis maculosa]|uniref:DNA 3'-5' helicase n=1 Tax=Mycoplasmopsis maculosa TaxID=114885 RepID=A0A449B3M0_9BACT|nr:UvrD-helicase domain-containing protein [Mycoplasmopsis maculosa]VEU75193.1 ATP-dependent DNA helicase UvrD/PcrA [Mycoplasmopsis maculosa]
MQTNTNINREDLIIEGLNDDQKEALYHFDSPLRIIAGAGSGKTRVLTRKIAYLINVLGISPEDILAVTFTNKAANEMADRVKQYTNNKLTKGNVDIATFHSLCAKILRIESSNIGLKNDFQIIDDIDKKSILKNIYKRLDIETNDLTFKNLIRIFSWAKNKHYTNDEIRKYINTEFDYEYGDVETIINVFSEYTSYLIERASLDFDDLIIKVNELFNKNHEIAKKWSAKYSYILVDEFQDTSLVQYEVIKVLASGDAQLTIVGDPDQTIYRWRNADVNLILNFEKDFPKTKTIILNKNYRSTKKILEAANSLIKHNLKRFNKDLITDKEEGTEIEFSHAFSPEAEVRWVVQKINELKKQKIQLKNIAIFYRSNSYAKNFEEQLINENISYKIFGGEKFYQRKEIKDALAFLRVIYDGNDLPLLRIINIPPKKIGEKTILKLQDMAKEKKLSIFNTLVKHYKEIDAPLNTVNSIIMFLNYVLKYRKALSSNPIHVVLHKFLQEVGYYNYISQDVGLKGTGEENIKILINGIEEWEKNNPDKTIKEYFDYISLLSAYDATDESLSYVSLMTVHSAKGLEFDNVFLVGMSENIFPHYKSVNNPEAIEEERRLAYVAITRAKNKLFVSDSRGVHLHNNNEKVPSRFLKEMGIDTNDFILQVHDASVIDIQNGVEKKSREKNKNILRGDIISHTFFGEGEVIEVLGDTIHVHFKTYGLKSLAKNHESIRLLKEK